MAGDRDQVLEIAQVFGEVARALAGHDVQVTLDKVVTLAVKTLDACEFAGITMVEKGKVTSPASSHDVPRIIDELQGETGEGPCIDAIVEHEVFMTGDLAAESRWPRFATRAHGDTGVRSILSMRLFVDEDTLGALNLYSTSPDAFDDTDEALAAVFAAHAAVALSSSRQEERLQQKAETRDLIGRAKGILMAREHVTDEHAFDMLRRVSQRLNVKLRDVAGEITRSVEVESD